MRFQSPRRFRNLLPLKQSGLAIDANPFREGLLEDLAVAFLRVTACRPPRRSSTRLIRGRPETFNSDQGSPFTAAALTGPLEACGVPISMHGRGRAIDNVFIEQLWRSVKYEEIYLKDSGTA